MPNIEWELELPRVRSFNMFEMSIFENDASTQPSTNSANESGLSKFLKLIGDAIRRFIKFLNTVAKKLFRKISYVIDSVLGRNTDVYFFLDTIEKIDPAEFTKWVSDNVTETKIPNLYKKYISLPDSFMSWNVDSRDADIYKRLKSSIYSMDNLTDQQKRVLPYIFYTGLTGQICLKIPSKEFQKAFDEIIKMCDDVHNGIDIYSKLSDFTKRRADTKYVVNSFLSLKSMTSYLDIIEDVNNKFLLLTTIVEARNGNSAPASHKVNIITNMLDQFSSDIIKTIEEVTTDISIAGNEATLMAEEFKKLLKRLEIDNKTRI